MQGRPRVKRAVLVLFAAAMLGAGIAVAASTTVSLTASGPQPAFVTVNWGDTVEFVNSDSAAHSLQSTAPEIGSTTMAPGQTLPVTFTGVVGLKRYATSGARKPFRAAVLVALNGRLDLAAKASVLTYGGSTRLTGHLSLGPGVTVTLQQRPLDRFQHGTGVWRPLGNPLSPDSSGAFGYDLKPSVGSEYQAVAAAGQLLSRSVKVLLVPSVAVVAPRRVRSGTAFAIRITVRPASAAASVTLERYDSKSKRWRQAGKPRLSRGRVKLMTAVPAGVTRLRVSVGLHDLAGEGFLPVGGKPFAVTGT